MEPGFQLFASGSKKQISTILIPSAVRFDWSRRCRTSLEPQQKPRAGRKVGVRPESSMNKSLLRPDPKLQPVYVSRLVARLDQAGSSIVLKYRDETITGHAFLASIFRFARALSNIGVGPNSLVALLAPNHSDALAIRYASNMIGAAATYLSVPSSAEARATLLRQIAP